LITSADLYAQWSSRGKSAEDDPEELNRRQIVTLVFVIYWLLIFEGVLRKWLFPEFQRALFFIRDPFVLLIYWFALTRWTRLFPSPFLVIGLLFAWLSGEMIFVQTIFRSSGNSLLLAGYGWRNYFFYIPLAFVIAEHFRQADLERLIRQTLLVAIPIAVLVFLQVKAPANAAINLGTGKGSENQFHNLGVAFGIVRPFGTFTSTSGQRQFVVSAFAMMLAVWIMPKIWKPIKGVALFAATCAVLMCLGLSGSRGAFIHSGLVILTSFATGLLLYRWRMASRTWAFPIIILVLVALLIPLVFPTAFEAFASRWVGAYKTESYIYGYGIFGRSLSGFYKFTTLLSDTPLLGYGMGLGGNASTLLGIRHGGVSPLELAESDWSRHIIDLGPVLGVLFIVFRISFVIWLGMRALAATRRSGHVLSLLLFGYVGIVLLDGQITGHGTINGYGWLFAGFCMAASRFGTHAKPSESQK